MSLRLVKTNLFCEFTAIVLVYFFSNGCGKNLNIDHEVSLFLPFDKNPSEMWQIGYSKTKSLSPDEFVLSSFADQSDVIGMWHPSSDAPGYYPYLGQNRAQESRVSTTQGWALRAGQIAMEASNSGQYSLLRFVAPAAGNYDVAATFEGIHYGLSSTDVHVLLNAESLFDNFIEGYGGDPQYHRIEGNNPSSSYSNEIKMKTNDILIFAVGYGRNENHYNDTTGLELAIHRK